MNIEEGIKFISLVERYPILYNKRSGGFRRTDLKLKRWQEIAKQMKFHSAQTAQKKWKYYRDKYVKIKRDEKKIASGAMAAPEEDMGEWPLQTHLQFLDEYIHPRGDYIYNIKHKTSESESSMLSQDEGGDIQSDQYIKTEEEMLMEDSDVDPSIEPSRSSSPTTQSDTTRSRHDTLDLETRRFDRVGTLQTTTAPIPPSVDAALEIISSYFRNKSNEDTDHAFTQYVATEMKAMSTSRKQRFKRLVMDFICEED